ncbi:MAG: hypothetical protein QOF33_2923 [Thermomicrobiales bacterium]|jgi:hypothetical protein|nr:hypothetical protein [Thermomicrobiales bacterium]
MTVHRVLSSLLAVIVLLAVPSLTAGQSATPAASPIASNVSVVASGLTNPRGFVWGPDGALYVALAGSGGHTPATAAADVTYIVGPFLGGLTGAVARIERGCPVAVALGLPSTVNLSGEVLGAEDVAFLGGQLYVSVDGGGSVHGNELNPSGIYRVNDDGTTDVVVNLSGWLRSHPVTHMPHDFDPDSDGYRMVADEAAGVFWILEPNSGGVLAVTPDGTITRIVDLSAPHPVPAAIALAPGGGVYVGMLTPAPFTDGAAKIIHVAADGTMIDVWTGLTTVTGIAVGPDGVLYAAELSTGNQSQPPYLVPGSGKVVRQTGHNSAAEVATGLMLPIALGFGPDGGLYVSLPAIGASQGQGTIVRLNGSGAASPAAPPTCTPLTGTTAPPVVPAVSPAAG